jgi:HK97 gp10 family phage protein
MSITLGQLADRFAKAAQNLPGVTDKRVEALAQVGVGYMKQEIQAVHAVDTGTMLNSVTSEKAGQGSYLIGPTVKYAPYVALGTSRMPARPFHITAARRLQADVAKGDILKELGLA